MVLFLVGGSEHIFFTQFTCLEGALPLCYIASLLLKSCFSQILTRLPRQDLSSSPHYLSPLGHNTYTTKTVWEKPFAFIKLSITMQNKTHYHCKHDNHSSWPASIRSGARTTTTTVGTMCYSTQQSYQKVIEGDRSSAFTIPSVRKESQLLLLGFPHWNHRLQPS